MRLQPHSSPSMVLFLSRSTCDMNCCCRTAAWSASTTRARVPCTYPTSCGTSASAPACTPKDHPLYPSCTTAPWFRRSCLRLCTTRLKSADPRCSAGTFDSENWTGKYRLCLQETVLVRVLVTCLRALKVGRIRFLLGPVTSLPWNFKSRQEIYNYK